MDRRSFLALPLVSVAPFPAIAESKVGFVVSDSFHVLGVSVELEDAKKLALRLETERYEKWYNSAVQEWGKNAWWRENTPANVYCEVRHSRDNAQTRWEVWQKNPKEWHRTMIKIDAVQMV